MPKSLADPASTSLTDFAKADPVRVNKCGICRLADRVEIDEGLRNGIAIATINRWLEKRGTSGCTGALEGHKRRGHHNVE